VLRWLVAAVTILVLASSGIRAYANAGVKTDITCCCPNPDVCKCHGHHGDRQPANELERCGGAVHVDAPIVVATTLPEPPVATVPTVVVRTPEWAAPRLPEDRFAVPETPPF